MHEYKHVYLQWKQEKGGSMFHTKNLIKFLETHKILTMNVKPHK